MKFVQMLIVFTLSSFAETYISGSIITNSIISDNSSSNQGSGVLVSKNISTSSFNKIKIDIPANVAIRQAENKHISVQTDDNVIDKIKIYVKNNTLFIQTKEGFQSSKGIKISINSPHLNQLTVDGAATIKLDGFSEKHFLLDIDGASDISFSGGNFNNFVIKADGSYEINLRKVTIKEAKVNAKGSGEIELNIQDNLKVNLEDTVEVKYLGNPTIKKSIKDVSELIHI